MGERCCKNQTSAERSDDDASEQACYYEPTQEPIFPPELMVRVISNFIICYDNNNNKDNHLYLAALQQSLQYYVLQSKNITIYLAHPRIR